MSSGKCLKCNKTVYKVEEAKVNDKVFHKGCLKCEECDTKLTTSNATRRGKKLYCKKHVPEEEDDDEEEDDSKEEKEDDEEKEEKGDEGDEQVLPGIQEHFLEMVGNEEMADVHFVLKKDKEDVRIPAHRVILASHNDVFRAMLYPLTFSTDFKTATYNAAKIPTDEKDIKVDGVTPDAFKKMLTIVYTDKLEDMSSDDIKELLPLAKKFQIEALRLKCVSFMEEEVTAENCCALLEQGRTLLNEASFGMKFIEENTSDVIESDSFLTLSKESLISILKSNGLSVDEVSLFEAVDKWAEAECKRQSLKANGANKRTVLGDVMNYIRFPQMSMSEVCSKVQGAGLLQSDELLSLFTYLGADKESKPKCKWPTKPREGGASFKGSTILSAQQQKILNSYYSKEKKAKWTLVYKGKKDGLTASSFHAKVDNAGPTMTIIKASGTNYIFGGFSEQSWGSSAGHRADPKAFLFSMVNRPNRPCRWTISNSSYAIYANSSYGPTFGSGYDIYVASSMTSTSNYCSSSSTYRCDDTSISTTTFTDFFGGSYNWTVDDVETFALAKKTDD
eukprot:TRINITY_DN445_c0_g1_i1.p1 TRINITY_DN445_c0_g1~~TRINITY_DN445_c0_g1_i1.p1  ORF type:complete len:562 (-),score=164.15 TRINITY_DN445_c0_g1_i1:132-1817(-)